MTDRTGLLAFWKNYDRKLYLRAAQLADELGYDSFWVPEAWGYEVFSLLTEMALTTKRIKLGTGIANVFSRSPGLLAMSAATLDEISEGRFILGIGTSGARVIEGFHGRPFEKPLTQTRDVIRVVRTLLSGGKLSDAGAENAVVYRPFTLEMGRAPRRPHLRGRAQAEGDRVHRRARRRLDPHLLALRAPRRRPRLDRRGRGAGRPRPASRSSPRRSPPRSPSASRPAR